jgi:hypothetical protein
MCAGFEMAIFEWVWHSGGRRKKEEGRASAFRMYALYYPY